MWRADKAGWIAVIGLSLAVAACGGKGSEQPSMNPVDPAATPAPTDPATAPAPEDKGSEGNVAPADPADPGAKPADPGTKPADPGTKPADPAAADPDAADAGSTAGADPADTKVPSEAADGASPNGYTYPGRNTVVKDPDPESPEGIIMRALAAALDPDEAKGWEAFEGLLHTSELIPNALTSRRQLNWPAMRRKVALFLVEEGKPVYKWAYAEEPEPGVIKVFVNNPKSMPTPCYVAQDPEQENKWRIKSCSL